MWLQLYAKKHNDVGLMVEVMKLLKRNDLPYQSGTADIVFRYIIDHKRCFVLFAFPYSSYSKNFYTTMLIGWTLISEISSSYGLVGWGCDKFQVSTFNFGMVGIYPNQYNCLRIKLCAAKQLRKAVCAFCGQCITELHYWLPTHRTRVMISSTRKHFLVHKYVYMACFHVLSCLASPYEVFCLLKFVNHSPQLMCNGCPVHKIWWTSIALVCFVFNKVLILSLSWLIAAFVTIQITGN